MDKLRLVALFIALVLGSSSTHANPILSVVPSSGLLSTGYPGLQVQGSSQIVQLVRQPGLVSQGITQLPLGLGGASPQQILLNNGGLVTTTLPSGLLGSNIVGTHAGGLLGLNAGGFSNFNGVPILISPGAGLAAGLSTIPQFGDTTTLLQQHPLLNTQPVVSVNPVVRQVAEVETPASLVQIDPMDAALAEMENQGQIHMEKYAWGRSALNKAKTSSATVSAGNNDAPENYRSYYSPVPVGTVVGSGPGPVDLVNRQPTSQTRNPFVDANGKRKKHFEFYQYFRNLNPSSSSPQAFIPVAVLPTQQNTPADEE